MTDIITITDYAALPKEIFYLDPKVFLNMTTDAAIRLYVETFGHEPAAVYHMTRPNGRQAIYIPANGKKE